MPGHWVEREAQARTILGTRSEGACRIARANGQIVPTSAWPASVQRHLDVVAKEIDLQPLSLEVVEGDLRDRLARPASRPRSGHSIRTPSREDHGVFRPGGGEVASPGPSSPGQAGRRLHQGPMGDQRDLAYRRRMRSSTPAGPGSSSRSSAGAGVVAANRMRSWAAAAPSGESVSRSPGAGPRRRRGPPEGRSGCSVSDACSSLPETSMRSTPATLQHAGSPDAGVPAVAAGEQVAPEADARAVPDGESEVVRDERVGEHLVRVLRARPRRASRRDAPPPGPGRRSRAGSAPSRRQAPRQLCRPDSIAILLPARFVAGDEGRHLVAALGPGDGIQESGPGLRRSRQRVLAQ